MAEATNNVTDFVGDATVADFAKQTVPGIFDHTKDGATPISSPDFLRNTINRISAENATLKVTPEDLQAKSESVLTKTAAAEAAFNEMKDIVSRTTSYWLGEAGDKHRSMFEEKDPDMREILKRFNSHAANLKAIASKYLSTENEIKEEANQLPADAII